jgi:hypothetical protein
MHSLFSSVVSYEDRGQYGNNKYRGNCSGKLVEDLLDYYQPKKFIEIFAGGGTGYEVARAKGYNNSIHLDLNPRWGGWNALTDEIPAGSDLIFSHPPYHNMVVYSGEMWGEPDPRDLSRCASYEEFIHKQNIVNSRIFNSLRNGGRHAILTGDMRKSGNYYSIIKDMVWYGDLEAHVVKVQHNTDSDRKKYGGKKFIPIKHEHLLIFRKNEIWAVNVKITHTEERDLRNSRLITWRDLIQATLEKVGGQSDLPQIYDALKDTEKAKANPNWQAKIRQQLQYGDEFASIRRGVWSLNYSQQLKTA